MSYHYDQTSELNQSSDLLRSFNPRCNTLPFVLTPTHLQAVPSFKIKVQLKTKCSEGALIDATTFFTLFPFVTGARRIYPHHRMIDRY